MKFTKELIKKLCVAGGMAPSGGNIQPWRVIAYDNVLELKIDPSRSSFLDVSHLASIFSLGSFFENLRITADSLGLSYDLKFQEFKNPEDTVAKVIFKDEKDPISNPLEQFINKRATNRQVFDGAIIDEATINELVKEVKDFDKSYALVCIADYDEKEKIIDTLGKADGVRTYNETLHTQMFNELRWNNLEAIKTKDGIDIATMELPIGASKLFKQLKNHPFVRNLLPRRVFEDMAKPLLRNSSHLCVLSTSARPTSETMFLAGQIMERIWLIATRLGLAVHPWTILPFLLLRAEHFSAEGFNQKEAEEILQLGKELRKNTRIAKDETPLFIFRLSKAKAPSANSLRLPWEHYTKIKA